MRNRKLLMVLSLLLALTVSLIGTLAYLTDTDNDVNVMTLGNVDIEQYEKDADGNDFKQNQPLYPAYYEGDDWKASTAVGAIDKVVSVKNVGSSEAYVRTILAFEAGNLTFDEFETNIHLLFNSAVEAKLEWIKTTPIEVKGVNYYVACVDYDKLAGNTMADSSLLKVVMNKHATNEIVAQFNGEYDIIALSQAVQTKNRPSAEAAWKDSFGEFNATNAAEWLKGVEQVPADVISDADGLAAALANGGTVVVADDIDADASMNIGADTAATLALNGFTVSGDVHKNDGPVLKNDGKLAVTGGTIKSTAGNGGSAIMNNGELTVDNATLNGASNEGGQLAVLRR